MELEPWEALDIDDSDLSNFLRPCNNNTPTTSVSPLIPGPAGAVQSAMMQRRTLPASNLLPTQEFLCRALQNGHDTDRDFTANPWLSALQFLRSSQGRLIHSFIHFTFQFNLNCVEFYCCYS